MKIQVTIETQDPNELKRVADALAGFTSGPTTGEQTTPAPKPRAAPKATQAEQPPATTQESSSSNSAVPTEAELVASANAAVTKLGANGPAKIKAYIAANFQQADGKPGTLKLTKPEQRAALLENLNKIAAGTLTV